MEAPFKDGEALLKTGEPQRRNGAIYAAGYGVQCALKARICLDRGKVYLDQTFHCRDLRRLAEAAALWPAIERDRHLTNRLTHLYGAWRVTLRCASRPYDPHAVRVFIGRAREFAQWLFEN